jgi:hypothetical protein
MINWGQIPINLRLPANPTLFGKPAKYLQSRTAWGAFCERKSSKMCPHGGRLIRDFKQVQAGVKKPAEAGS